MLTKVAAKTSTKAKTAKAVKKVAAPKTLAGKVAQGLSQQAAVQKDFGYTSAVNNAQLDEADYNTQTAATVQQAKAAQTAANAQQDMTTQTQRQASAEDYAARGIIRSGLQVDAQNGITATDTAARAGYATTEMGVEQQRQQGLLDLQSANRDKTATALNTATQNYYSTLKKAK